MWRSKPLWRGLGLLCVVIVAGCRVPAQIVWSPDGKTAAYRVEDKAYLVDSTGKLGAPLGTVAGGMAWSADSKTLYYAMSAKLANPIVKPDTIWQSMPEAPEPTSAPATAPASQPAKFVELEAFAKNKATALARFAAGDALYMALSPDQKWLAIVCETPVDTTFAVYVFNLPTKHLYLLSDFAGFGLCFTGPNRLAYIEPDRRSDKDDAMTGKVVEVTLDVKSPQLARTPLLDVIPSQTPFIQPLGENLLLTSVGRSFPGKPLDDTPDRATYKLFMWTRANGGIVSLVDDVGPLFAISPDGQRVLIEKLSPATDRLPAKRELQLIRANGSDGYTLRDLSKHDLFPLWPAWHGNDEITFTSPDEDAKTATVDKEQRLIYDMVQYQITEKGELKPIQTLSESWKADEKPYLPGK
jgi:hypothetical protein